MWHQQRVPAILLAVALLIGCGRVGAIRPPEDVSPRPVTELTVSNGPLGIDVRFQRPTETVDGMDMDDLAYLEVWRTCTPPAHYQRITRVPIIDRGTMRKPRWTEMTDFDPSPGDACTYSVFAETADGYRSDPVQSETIIRRLPTEPAP